MIESGSNPYSEYSSVDRDDIECNDIEFVVDCGLWLGKPIPAELEWFRGGEIRRHEEDKTRERESGEIAIVVERGAVAQSKQGEGAAERYSRRIDVDDVTLHSIERWDGKIKKKMKRWMNGWDWMQPHGWLWTEHWISRQRPIVASIAHMRLSRSDELCWKVVE